MSPNTQRKKLILIGSIVVIICVILPATIFLINSQYSATLNTTIAPSFATLIIDGKEYPTNKELRLKPSQTKATISADGFQSQEIDLTLEKGQTTTIAIFLTPDDGNLSWYYDHPEEQSLFQTVGGAQATIDAQDFLDEHPISEILPYSYADIINDTIVNYRIDIGKFDKCESNLCIKITDYSIEGNGYNYAINFIKENGFNPNNYQIFYEQESPWKK